MNGKDVKELREGKGLTQRELSELTKVPLGTIGRIESTKKDIYRADVLKSLQSVLIGEDSSQKFTNDGNIIKEHGNSYNSTPSVNNDEKGVPYYDIDFMGGFDLVFNSQQVNPAFYIDFLPFNDADCWINVSGKSMGPLIAHGDIIALKQVPDWRRFLLEGEIYAVVTDNGFRTIKMIGPGEDKLHYSLIPYNKSEEYKPQEIPKEVITHVFRVKGAIKKFF